LGKSAPLSLERERDRVRVKPPPPSGAADLPEGWAKTALGEVLTIQYGRGLKESVRRPGKVQVFGSNGRVGVHDAALTKGETVVIGRKGSVGEVHFCPDACWPIDTTYYIDDFGPFEPRFLSALLRTAGLAELEASSAIPGINRDQLYQKQIPVVPLPEQRRIVAKVEELLSEVNQVRELLARVPAILNMIMRFTHHASAVESMGAKDGRVGNTRKTAVSVS